MLINRQSPRFNARKDSASPRRKALLSGLNGESMTLSRQPTEVRTNSARCILDSGGKAGLPPGIWAAEGTARIKQASRDVRSIGKEVAGQMEKEKGRS